jgi:hypothetical protein
MNRCELIEELKKSAADSLILAGELPSSVLGIAIGWAFEPDPNDSLQREGLRITWCTYFQSSPNEDELEFADSCSDGLVDYLWRRIIWIEHENEVSSGPLRLPPQLDYWLFLR